MKKDQKNKSRPPVIAILGHVDHGKTTLVEALSNEKIAHKEAGGITQHVSAWVIDVNGQPMTVIDTPGHEAYSNIRSRGANITDIGLLVVAVDDGVKPQTKEAIKFLKESKVPIVVAANKIDRVDNKETALEQLKGDLAKLEVVTEDWGGDAILVPISAKDKKGLDKLKEILTLVTEVEELKDVNNLNEGIVLESYKDSQEGKTALILIKKGGVKKGDYIIGSDGKENIRQLRNYKNQNIDEVSVSMPLRLISLKQDLQAGDIVFFSSDAEDADLLVDKACELSTIKVEHNINEIADKANLQEDRILNILIRTDTCSNKEAIGESLTKINEESEDFKIKVIKIDVGDVSDTDVLLAESMEADMIVGFNVNIPKETVSLANNQGIKTKSYKVIYKILEDLEDEAKHKIDREIESKILGQLEILKVFRNTSKEALIGGMVTKGVVRKGVKFKLLRDEEQIGEGKVITLHIQKDQVDEVKMGNECGLVVPGGLDFQEKDIVEFQV